ncbi:MAG: hypothetical protein L0Y70_26445 [Gemmataceae bacterium]|nr:hypothetical protein [Gemmataceae bacterium]
MYELLTGRPPFRAETPLDTVMQVLHNDPVPPSLLNSKVDADLETICLKCLEKEPALRYASAQALAEDLQNYLNGDSINARSSNVLDRLTRMLERSQHDYAFATWSSMLLIMGVVVGVQNLAVFALMQWDAPRWTIQTCRFVQFALLGLLFWYNRGSRLLPTSSAERELWTIWIGYFFSNLLIVFVVRLIRGFDFMEPTGLAPRHFEETLTYPFLAIATGLAFFIMGSNYWGRCYAIGLAFFVIAAVMPYQMELAPLEFGAIWCAALIMLGLRLRRVGQLVEAQKKQPPHEHSTVAARK